MACGHGIYKFSWLELMLLYKVYDATMMLLYKLLYKVYDAKYMMLLYKVYDATL